jgi:hypothetical protein
LIFNFLQFAIDGKNNYKTKVEKVFFFFFISSYAEISFLKFLIRVKKFVGNRFIWTSKNPYFYADFKMGLFIFVSSSDQKLEPNNSILRDFPKKSFYLAITFEQS